MHISASANRAHVESVGDDAIIRAADLLCAGKLVAFPTETVYGLGADAENVDAVMQIYAIKGRPEHHPLIVHLAAPEDILFWAENVTEKVQRLLRRFAPGPITLILPRAAHVNTVVTGGQDTIGVRIPAHPAARQSAAGTALPHLRQTASAIFPQPQRNTLPTILVIASR